MKQTIDESNKQIPNHIGLILDGNRRWAKSKGLPPMKGHRAGYMNLKDIAKECFGLGINYVSAYVFSTENWDRSKDEVDYLMKLLLWVAKNEINKYHEENIKVVFIGEKDKLSDEIIKQMGLAETKTKENDGGTLVICLNYGGSAEIVGAVNSYLGKNPDSRKLSIADIEDNLYGESIPDVDLIIRTSGEQRLSNFMLWRAAYSELYFTDTYWPDFGSKELNMALGDYSHRCRRFGKDG